MCLNASSHLVMLAVGLTVTVAQTANEKIPHGGARAPAPHQQAEQQEQRAKRPPIQFPAVVVHSEQRLFTGEPITISLKDADLKNVLKVFSQLTNLNIVVDPSVRGSVTVNLRNVPWDQALDLILRMNGVGWEIEGNVVYVAPMAKLARW